MTIMPHAVVPEPKPPRPSLPARFREWRRRAAAWCARQWRQIRPGPEARRGAVWGALAAAAVCVVIAGLYARTGFGYAFDFALAVVLWPRCSFLLSRWPCALLLTIARRLPRMATGMIVGSCAIVMLAWMPPQLGLPRWRSSIGLTEGVLGATIATFVAGHFRAAALRKKIVTVSLCVLAVAGEYRHGVAVRAPGVDGKDHLVEAAGRYHAGQAESRPIRRTAARIA